jgi:hypothetical protein
VASDVSVGSSAGLDLGPPTGSFQTLEPIFGSPAIGLVPFGMTVGSESLCPSTDILGESLLYLGACNAGAIQDYTPVAPTGSATGVTATPGNGQATVVWTPPSLAAAGGEITGYSVIPHNITTGQDGAPASVGVDTLVVTGLVNGDTYTFTVVTKNSAGSGPPSAASAAVTVQAPTTTTTTATTTTTTPPPTTTSTPPPPTIGTVKTKLTTSRTITTTFDNQKLTVVTPPTSSCLAPSKRATVTLKVAAIPKSKKAELTFVSAVFTLRAKQSHTSRRASSSETFSLKGLKKGAYAVKVVVTFRERLAHSKTKTVARAIVGRLSVC